MKKVIFFLFAVVFTMAAGISAGQISKNISKIAVIKDPSGWIQFKENQQLNPETIFTLNKSEFGLTSTDQMLINRTEADKLGFTHHRFQQYYKGIPVEGGEFLIHSTSGKAISGNGKIITGLNLASTPALSPQDAIDKALAYTHAEKYMWEDPASEATLKKARKDPTATYQPKARLVIIDKHYGTDASKYVLAYKVEVYASKPLSYKNIFVNANNGLFITPLTGCTLPMFLLLHIPNTAAHKILPLTLPEQGLTVCTKQDAAAWQPIICLPALRTMPPWILPTRTPIGHLPMHSRTKLALMPILAQKLLMIIIGIISAETVTTTTERPYSAMCIMMSIMIMHSGMAP